MRGLLASLLCLLVVYSSNAQASRDPTDDERTTIGSAVISDYTALPASCVSLQIVISTVDPRFAVAYASAGTPLHRYARLPFCQKFTDTSYDLVQNGTSGWQVVDRLSKAPPCSGLVPGPVLLDLVRATLADCWTTYVKSNLPTIPTDASTAVSCGIAQSPAGKRYALFVPAEPGTSVCANARSAVFTWHGQPQRKDSPFGWVYVNMVKQHPGSHWTDLWVRNDEAVIVLAVIQP